MRCAVGGCGNNPTIMAGSFNTPQGIAIDGTSIYVAVAGGNAIVKITPK